MEIRSAKRYLGNSMFKQLCHMTSELFEIWIAWIKWLTIGRFSDYDYEKDFGCELIDLQGSTQTMLEGPMDYTEWYIDYLRREVQIKNEQRGYYEEDRSHECS